MEQFEQSEPAESPVDIKAYLHLFWSWAWLIVLAGVLAGGAAYVISKRSTPTYEASTRLLVSAPSTISGVDPSILVTTQTMTSTYSEMLLDRPVLQGVISQLKLSTTPEDLKKSISVDVVTNTQLLVINVQNQSPGQAADIANALASTFTARIRDLQSQRYSASREGLAAQVTDMEQQIATTSGQIAAIEQQMTAAGTQIVEAGGTGATPASTAAAATQTVEAAGNGATRAPPAEIAPESAALLQLQARLTQYRTIYSNLVTSYEQVRLAEEQTSTNVVVSEPATAASSPVRPKTTQNTLLVAVAGMLMASGVVFVADKLDDTIKNPEEVRQNFNVPILGMIASHRAPEDKPIALAEPRSPTTEAFRSLRTNIIYAAIDRPLRRILITSPTPQEGKTIIASNLAVVFSQSEKEVVLLDADLRRPQVHHKFGLQNRIGLSELFARPLDTIASVVNDTHTSGLAVITAGGAPPNPAELLTSKKMSQILDWLNRDFDLIVIDTSPLLTVTDAAALAPAADGVILVVKPGNTKLGAFKQALEQLRAVNAHILGVVLNDVDPASRKYGYYYSRYYSKYSRYYEEGGRGRKEAEKHRQAPEAEPVKTTNPPSGIS